MRFHCITWKWSYFSVIQNRSKTEFVRIIQRRAALQLQEADEMVDILLEIIKESLESGEEVLISGVGKFELRDKKTRPGRDPQTGKQYKISERRVVTFYPSKIWREELNG